MKEEIENYKAWKANPPVGISHYTHFAAQDKSIAIANMLMDRNVLKYDDNDTFSKLERLVWEMDYPHLVQV